MTYPDGFKHHPPPGRGFIRDHPTRASLLPGFRHDPLGGTFKRDPTAKALLFYGFKPDPPAQRASDFVKPVGLGMCRLFRQAPRDRDKLQLSDKPDGLGVSSLFVKPVGLGLSLRSLKEGTSPRSEVRGRPKISSSRLP